MAQFLKIYKKTALSWWFEVDNNGELRTISDFEVNIGNSFNIVEIDGSKISISNIANITIIDETNSTNFTFISPILLEQKLRALNFVPYRDQSAVTGSGIVDAPAIAGTGTTIMTFDEIRYHGLTTQTGPISLSLNATPNINKNGRIQVLDINGNSVNTFTPPANSINSNGVAFDNTKNNVIYYDFVNGKLKYNITLQNLPDVIAPTLVSAIVQNANPSNIELTYIEPLTVSPLPAFSDFALNLSKTVTAISIVGSVVTLTVNAPYVTGNLPTVSYTSGVNKIKDLAGNIAVNLVGQVVTNNVGLICLDDFNSVNRTDLAGRRTTFPAVGYLWLKFGAGTGTLGIVNNILKNTGALLDMNNIYYFDIGTRNLDISLTFKVVGTPGYSNLEFARVSDGERYYITSAGNLRKVVGGINTLVSAISGGLVNGDVVRCVLTNAVIEVYKNGAQVYTGASDPAITGTNIGIYVYQDDVVEFDNLIIY